MSKEERYYFDSYDYIVDRQKIINGEEDITVCDFCDWGKIVDILNEQDQRIAELEEQLKNAIVPKFKIGQEFWYVYAGEVRKGTVFMLHIDKGGIVYESYVDDTRYSICTKCDKVFATKEEAEAKLKELQGEIE